jgi:CDGSH-type Zn-finger protein
MADVTIKVRKDGPYLVTGPIDLIDHEGKPISIPEGKGVALCRCGASTKKPFCDATHSKIGFQGASQAVAEAEGKTGE